MIEETYEQLINSFKVPFLPNNKPLKNFLKECFQKWVVVSNFV